MKIFWLLFVLMSCITPKTEINPDTLASVRQSDRSVIHFWATWCASCKEELNQIDEDLNDLTVNKPDIVFVLVSVDIDTDLARQYLYENHPRLLRYAYYDPSASIPSYFDLNMFPATVIANKGKMLKTFGYDKNVRTIRKVFIELEKLEGK